MDKIRHLFPRLTSLSFMTFIKAQAVFIMGSVADFAATIFFVEALHAPYLAGNLAGNITGAATQFMLCRSWVFHAEENRMSSQVIKFILVYAGDLLLSAAGVYFFTHFMGVPYIVSKLITSMTLGLTYNYFLQKQFVFPTS